MAHSIPKSTRPRLRKQTRRCAWATRTCASASLLPRSSARICAAKVPRLQSPLPRSFEETHVTRPSSRQAYTVKLIQKSPTLLAPVVLVFAQLPHAGHSTTTPPSRVERDARCPSRGKPLPGRVRGLGQGGEGFDPKRSGVWGKRVTLQAPEGAPPSLRTLPDHPLSFTSTV